MIDRDTMETARATLLVLDRLIQQVIRDAQAAGVEPWTMRLPSGDYVLAPLVAAAAHLQAALIMADVRP